MMKHLMAILALAVVLGAAGLTVAQEPEGDQPVRRGDDRRARVIAAFDEDGDGVLSPQERQQLMRAISGGPGDRQGSQGRGPRMQNPPRGNRNPMRGGGPGGPPAYGPRDPRREGPSQAEGPRRPTAQMLLARFDQDQDRELDLQELEQLVAQMSNLRARNAGQAGGVMGPRRGFGPGGGPGFGPAPPSRDRGLEGRRNRPDGPSGDADVERPRGPRPDGAAGNRGFGGRRGFRPDGPTPPRGERRLDRDDEDEEEDERPAPARRRNDGGDNEASDNDD